MLFMLSGEDRMTVQVFVFFLLCFLMLSLLWFGRLTLLNYGLARWRAGALHPVACRLLKPRTPRDCPACRLTSTLSSSVEPASAPLA